MDGEISRETSRFLVRRLGADEELCATWARYHLVRDCLRHQDGGLSTDDLCSRVSRALEDEPVKTSRKISTAWLKPAVGMAIAASVALMAVLSVNPGGPGQQTLPTGLAESAELTPFTSPQTPVSAGLTQQASMAAGNKRINSYLLRHYQATGSGGKGVIAFTPVIIRPVSNAELQQQGDEASSIPAQEEQETQ